jgi:hypothetical protein
MDDQVPALGKSVVGNPLKKPRMQAGNSTLGEPQMKYASLSRLPPLSSETAHGSKARVDSGTKAGKEPCFVLL